MIMNVIIFSQYLNFRNEQRYMLQFEALHQIKYLQRSAMKILLFILPSLSSSFISLTMMFSVRTYVNHVRNINHLELANPLTKHTLLVVG